LMIKLSEYLDVFIENLLKSRLFDFLLLNSIIFREDYRIIYSPSALKFRFIDYEDSPWKQDYQMDRLVETVEAKLAKRSTLQKGKNPFRPVTMIREMSKIGRNEQCPCGSGKKYKKCCLNS
uniref:YecA family protein n=1 Tax=Acinetobacter baumannii TaxID=470 RepID=UPI00389271CE